MQHLFMVLSFLSTGPLGPVTLTFFKFQFKSYQNTNAVWNALSLFYQVTNYQARGCSQIEWHFQVHVGGRVTARVARYAVSPTST
jgi:hypothetical protein